MQCSPRVVSHSPPRQDPKNRNNNTNDIFTMKSHALSYHSGLEHSGWCLSLLSASFYGPPVKDVSLSAVGAIHLRCKNYVTACTLGFIGSSSRPFSLNKMPQQTCNLACQIPFFRATENILHLIRSICTSALSRLVVSAASFHDVDLPLYTGI